MGQRFLVVLLISLSSVCFSLSAAAQEPTWSYQGKTGPNYWGDLSEEYALCRQGVNQSPIDILDTTFDRLFSLGFIYKDVPLLASRRNHSIEIDYGEPIENGGEYIEIRGEKVALPNMLSYDSTLNISGETYTLQKINFHTPSEHKYEHKSYPLEVQLHHKNEFQQWAILSVFFETGQKNDLIEKLLQYISDDESPTQQPQTMINAQNLLPQQRGYYHYRGSLTTPPCHEGVRWFVFKESNSLSKSQLQKLTQEIKPNNRPLQAKNYRFLLESL